MPTISGQKYDVRRATQSQEGLIKKYVENKKQASKIYEENDQILKALSTEITNQCIVVKTEEGLRTYMLGEPKGKFVTYSKLDFVHDAKTIKVDLNSLESEVV